MRYLLAMLLLCSVLAAPAAKASAEDEILATYNRFLAAQNARDLAAVREVLSDHPRFLWISDGRAYWGREAMLERMGRFQTADVWHVTPHLAQAVPVLLNATTAFLHLPLTLRIGPAAEPSSIDFLVGVLCVRTEGGWRIAALFTTEDKRE
jgi:ketosteroid isomerase-like protein